MHSSLTTICANACRRTERLARALPLAAPGAPFAQRRDTSGRASSACDGPNAQDTQDADAPPPLDRRHPEYFIGAPLAFAFPGQSLAPLTQAFWAGVLVLALAAFWLLSRREKDLAREAAQDGSLQATDDALVLAVDQQAPLELKLLPRNNGAPSVHSGPLRGVCALLDGQSVFFQTDVALSGNELAAWAGNNAEGLLRLTSGTGAGNGASLLRFQTVVLRGMADARFSLLELARPVRLDHAERRTFPRVVPPPSGIIAAALWALSDAAATAPETPGSPLSLATLPSSPSGAPLLTWYPQAAAPSMRVFDLSASGIALKVNAASALPARAMLLLCLRQPSGRAMILWLACATRHVTRRGARPFAVAGLQITHWSEACRVDAPIVWQPRAAQGPLSRAAVPPLLRWTLRQRADARNGLPNF